MAGDVVNSFVTNIDDPTVSQRFVMLFSVAQHGRIRSHHQISRVTLFAATRAAI
jgi:hypothetical protein